MQKNIVKTPDTASSESNSNFADAALNPSGQKSLIPTKEAANTANWSTSLQTVLDQPPAALPHYLLWGGMVFCLASGAWATFGQMEEG